MFDSSLIPKVSIIMATYNRAAYIIETIESIRNQTYKNWELIIVDDGSDDNTEELIYQLEDKRIQFIKAGRTESKGKIVNMGLKIASGELFAFIDSDDIWASGKIEKQVSALQQYPKTGFCLTGGFNFVIPFEPTEYFYKKRDGIKIANVFFDYFRSELPGFTQALMLRKECIEVTGYFKEVKSFGDVEFILKLAYHYTAVILYEPLFFRRLHETNYIHSTWEKSYQEGIEIIRLYKTAIPSKLAADAFFKLYVNFGEDCLVNKQRGNAIKYFLTAWKNKPLSIIPIRKIGKAILSM